MNSVFFSFLVCALSIAFPMSSFASATPPAPIDDADYRTPASPEKIELGRMLFFDKIISGNKNISCASCHHPLLATGTGVSLTVGEGGDGLGRHRDTGAGNDAIHVRTPRDSAPIFNFGAHEYVDIFRDGLLMTDPSEPSGLSTPLGPFTPLGLDSVLSAQAIFPPAGIDEMTGQPGENPVADQLAVGNVFGPGGVWDLLAQRLRDIPEYVSLFMAAYPGKINSAQDITFVDAGNAIAAYEEVVYRADNTPFDQYLRGDPTAMSQDQVDGMNLFFGSAGCSSCHSGKFLTDHQYHAVAMPQIGPGKGDNSMGYADGLEDFGRERITGDPADRFKFRTPPLRNVALTAPYGHAGAYATLEAVVRHYIDPVASLNNYDKAQADIVSRPDLDALDFIVMGDQMRVNEIAQRNTAVSVNLSDADVDKLVAFLHALTDPTSVDLGGLIPTSVPSGLPLDPLADVCPTGCLFTSIQAAIDAAASGAEITVANGTYYETITLNDGKRLSSLGGSVVTTIDATGLGGPAVNLIDGTIDGFTLTGGTGNNGSGGGVFVSSGTVQNSIMRDNAVTGRGGGLYVSGQATVVNNRFIANTAVEGGGVSYVKGSTVVIQGNRFHGNTAERGGALSIESVATGTFSDNVFDNNSATYGGGIYVGEHINAVISNALVVDNSATYGAGVYVSWLSSMNLLNSTVSDNNGTGVYFSDNSGAVVKSAIIWGNEGGDINNPASGLPLISYSNIGGGYSGTGNINADPFFVNAAIGDYRLSSNSPAIDTGGDTGVLTDLEGNNRPADGDNQAAGATGDGSDYDMGAYEFQILGGVIGSDFSVTMTPAAQAVESAEAGNYVLHLSSIEGFSRPVSLNLSLNEPTITHAFSVNPVMLSPNGTANVDLTLQTSALTPDGLHSFTVESSDGGVTYSAAGQLDVLRLIEFAASDVNPPAQIGIEGKFDVHYTATNLGNIQLYPTIRIYLSSDPIITSSDTVLATTATLLKIGESKAVVTPVTLPSSVGIGQYYIGVRVDATNLWSEPDESNNTAASPPVEVVSYAADGIVSDVVADVTTIPVENYLTLTATVNNLGSNPMDNVSVNFYLSQDAVIDSSDYLVGSSTLPWSLNAGKFAFTSAMGTASVAPGQYYIGAVVDSENTTAELDETNNAAIGALIDVTGGMDLTVSSMTAPSQGISGGPNIPIDFTATNLGSDDITGFIWWGVYLSTDAVIDTNDQLIDRAGWTEAVVDLAAGESKNVIKDPLYLPYGIAPGQYYIGVLVDHWYHFAETDETNNATALPFEVVPR